MSVGRIYIGLDKDTASLKFVINAAGSDKSVRQQEKIIHRLLADLMDGLLLGVTLPVKTYELADPQPVDVHRVIEFVPAQGCEGMLEAYALGVDEIFSRIYAEKLDEEVN